MARSINMRGDAGSRSESAPVLTLQKPSRGLLALTSSALALPGIAGSASADAPIERAQASFSASYYLEDNLSPNKFLDDGVGSRERYEIYTAQLRFDLPVAERVDLGIQLLYEEMSGASPWYVVAGTSGELLQVMSGATIEEERTDLTLDLDYYLDTGKDTFSWGYSEENDYFSTHFGIGAERNFNDKNTTISLSGAFSYDWIDPTDADLFTTRQSHGEKWSLDLFGGLSQVLTRSTIGQITVNYKHSEGFLDDPYKQVASLDPIAPRFADVRPDMKDQFSLLLRVRQHIEPLNASMHLDYQFYRDSFEVTSHTLDLAWHQSVMDWLTLTPSFRYYSQSKAEFYEPILNIGPVPKEHSSDFRLSPYGAVSFRLKAEVHFEDLVRYDAPAWLQRLGVSEGIDLTVALSYERYLSDGDYALDAVDEGDEAPGLVKFQVFTLTLGGRF